MPKPYAKSRLYGIKQILKIAKTQKKFAKDMGVSAQAVNRWVKQGYVSRGKAAEAADFYRVPFEELCSPKFLQEIDSKKQ